MREKIKIRLVMYFVGLFIMTLGIAISVKSDLGVSPVSSIPYTITCVWGMEMGRATMLFYAALVVLQMILLRRKFKVKDLLQVVIAVVFGYFITFCNWCMSFLPTPENIVIRLVMILFSAVLIALGLFFYVPANIIPLPGEGATQTISDMVGLPFSRVKVVFDVSMVAISLIVCLVFLHSPGSVGIGTVIVSILTGTILDKITRLFGPWREKILGK